MMTRRMTFAVTTMMTLVLAGSWFGTALALDSVASGYWDDGATTWGGTAPTGSDNVTIKAGHTVTIRTNVVNYVKALTIETNGVLTHSANSTTVAGEQYKVVLDVAEDLTIDLGGKIDVEGKGYWLKQGPGIGSHGGKGGKYNFYVTGGTYGSFMSPTNLGSGGVAGNSYGGGAVILDVAGTSILDGTISANASLGNQGWGAAGGSVYLRTGAITGSPTITANGSNGYGGNGGGRVAIVLTNENADFSNFASATVSAYGGLHSSPNGAAGTIYKETQAQAGGQGVLTIDNSDRVTASDATTAIPSGQTWTVPVVTLSRGAILGIPAGASFDLTSSSVTFDAVSYNSGISLLGGTLIVPATFAYTNFTLHYLSASTFSPTSITVGNHAQFFCHVGYTLPADLTVQTGGTFTVGNGLFTVGGNVLVSGGTLTHLGNAATEAYKLNLAVGGNLTVQTNGSINVTAKGRTSPKVGSHGGVGGPHGTIFCDLTYGSVTAPTDLGRGGKGNGAPGGGAAILNVTGASDIAGTISANGGNSSGYSGPGGSVYIRTGTLTGDGTITVNGNNGATPGGGGRIAIVLTGSGADFSSFSDATLQAYGGVYGVNRGAVGTIYMETQPQEPSQGILLIKGDGTAPSAVSTTLISSNVTDAVVGTVIITNKAVLAVGDQVLTVQGDWDNAANSLGFLNGTVDFVGAGTNTVSGHNTFYNLTCTNAGKTLHFEDGKSNTVDGILTLDGPTLDSTSGSASWYLKASANMHSVSNVTVGRSDARPGAAIEAYDSTDQGGNFQWVFAESGFNTNIWIGTTDSNWSDTNNWSRGRSTIFTDTVVIPGGCPNYPLLDFDKRMLSLTISNGASMSLDGYNLTVDEDTRVAGALTATSTETLTLSEDLDFSGGGVFNPASSTVLMSGTNAQTVVSAGNVFHQVMIDNAAAPVAFPDAVSAAIIQNMGTPVTFAGNVTATTSFQSQGAAVTFGGAVDVPAFHNASGALVFGDTLLATSFYSENGALVFTGVVSTVSFTNWAGDATFHDNLSATTFYCAPGGNDLTFEAGKTYTIGDFLVYGQPSALMMMRSSSASYWTLTVTSTSDVRLVDVEYSNANLGETIRPLASTDSGDNPNWDFGGTWQTWEGSVSAVFTNENNWTPVGAPAASMHLLIDGYYMTPPILTGEATVTHVIVGGGVSTATLTVNGQLTTLEDVDVLLGGRITHSANTTSEDNRLFLTVGSNLTLAAGGQINVDAKGYTQNAGPGPGSHGGVGASYSTYVSSPTYGSITAPTHLGSGGFAHSAHGGGASIITVAGASELAGMITAVGESVAGWAAPGGSIYLRTGTITGSPTINANGSHAAGAGGGGRIAIVLTEPSADFSNFGGAVLSAYGGSGGTAGTIYLETETQGSGKGTLLVDANNIVSTHSTLISSNVIDTVVGTVIVKNKARLAIDPDQTLTVNGSWSNAATFVAENDSTVDFASPNAATVTANNTFYNLTAGAAGKTIRFEAGKTNTVNGKLTFRDNTTLLSTQDGTQWWLELANATGRQEVGLVVVKDSNASLGQEILAGNGSTDLKNNENWSFPAKGSVFLIR